MITRLAFVALQANYLVQLRELERLPIYDVSEAHTLRKRLAMLNRLYLGQISAVLVEQSVGLQPGELDRWADDGGFVND